MKDYDSQVEIVTEKKEASPHVRFKYVYIPCDVSEPMEEREMVTTKVVCECVLCVFVCVCACAYVCVCDCVCVCGKIEASKWRMQSLIMHGRHAK